MKLTRKKEILVHRAAVMTSIRSFFAARDFLEVETPYLVPSPGMEPYLEVFKTVFHPPDRSSQPLFLPTSPEFHMKRMLASGYERIFQISRAFRNEELGQYHNPEFTILEWYRANSRYEAIMSDIEELVCYTAVETLHRSHISRSGRLIELTPPWQRMTMAEVWRHFAGIDLEPLPNSEDLRQAGIRAGVNNLKANDPWDVLFFKIFLDRIEPHLGSSRPLILYEFPAEMAALARTKPGNPDVALRFEVYVDGIELANCFDELTEPGLQRERFEHSRDLRIKMGREPHPVDEGFISALETGIPPSAGIAVGVDRLIMLLLGKKTIHEVMAFSFADRM